MTNWLSEHLSVTIPATRFDFLPHSLQNISRSVWSPTGRKPKGHLGKSLVSQRVSIISAESHMKNQGLTLSCVLKQRSYCYKMTNTRPCLTLAIALCHRGQLYSRNRCSCHSVFVISVRVFHLRLHKNKYTNFTQTRQIEMCLKQTCHFYSL